MILGNPNSVRIINAWYNLKIRSGYYNKGCGVHPFFFFVINKAKCNAKLLGQYKTDNFSGCLSLSIILSLFLFVFLGVHILTVVYEIHYLNYFILWDTQY